MVKRPTVRIQGFCLTRSIPRLKLGTPTSENGPAQTHGIFLLVCQATLSYQDTSKQHVCGFKHQYNDVGILGSLSTMETAGLTMAFGSDLLGVMRHHQSDEFKIRAQVLSAQSIIASATSVAAKLLNPLVDISVLCGQREGIPIIKVAGSSNVTLSVRTTRGIQPKSFTTLTFAVRHIVLAGLQHILFFYSCRELQNVFVMATVHLD